MTYRISYKGLFINALLIIVLLAIVLLIKNVGIHGSIITIAVVICVYASILFANKRPIEIKISHSQIIITYNRFFVYSTHHIEQIAELSQSFKKEIGPRGIKIKVFRISKNNATILKIIPGFNGWSTNKLQMISNDLENRGVNPINP